MGEVVASILIMGFLNIWKESTLVDRGAGASFPILLLVAQPSMRHFNYFHCIVPEMSLSLEKVLLNTLKALQYNAK
jgi:hypothetical protein